MAVRTRDVVGSRHWDSPRGPRDSIRPDTGRSWETGNVEGYLGEGHTFPPQKECLQMMLVLFWVQRIQTAF
jgi:hypothetical protein